jgi:FkbM family methyltransferase
VTIRTRIREGLDRRYQEMSGPGHGPARWVLAAVGSADLIYTHRQPCCVLPSVGWKHYYRSGTIEWDSIGAPPPADLDRDTVDVFLHGYTPKAGDVVVDVGAGVGEEIPTFSRLVGRTGRVIAVEANPRAVDLLRRNIRRWRLRNVTVVQAAMAGEAGIRRITDDGASRENRVVTVGGVEVQAVTFSGLLDEAGIDRVDLLKMNIEGAEREALNATTPLDSVTHAAVSCHDFLVEGGGDPDLFATSEDVGAVLRGAGFDVVNRPSDERPWVRCYLYASRV